MVVIIEIMEIIDFAAGKPLEAIGVSCCAGGYPAVNLASDVFHCAVDTQLAIVHVAARAGNVVGLGENRSVAYVSTGSQAGGVAARALS